MNPRPWSRQKIETLADLFVEHRNKIVKELQANINYLKLVPPDEDTETQISENIEAKDIIDILGNNDQPLTSSQLDDIITLSDHLNQEGRNPFYNNLPDGFMPMIKIAKKIKGRDLEDIKIFVDSANTPKDLRKKIPLAVDELLFSDDSRGNSPKSEVPIISLDIRATNDTVPLSSVKPGRFYKLDQNNEPVLDTGKIYKFAILLLLAIVGISAYFMMESIIPGSGVMAATVAGATGVAAAGTAAAMLIDSEDPTTKTGNADKIELSQPQLLARTLTPSPRKQNNTPSSSTSPSTDLFPKKRQSTSAEYTKKPDDFSNK